MFGSEVLDVAASLVLVFLLVSLIATSIREGLEAFMKTRASHLEAGIRELLQDKSGSGLCKQIFDHPLIYSLYSGDYKPLKTTKKLWLTQGDNLPSYIPSGNFAMALLDLVARGPVIDQSDSSANAGPLTLESIWANISSIENPPVQRVILNAIDRAEGDLQKAQANIEAWYNSAMDRVSGWYKRSTQWILFGIGLSIAIVMNVNSLTLVNYLYHDKAARETLVARAQAVVADQTYPARNYGDIQKEISSLQLPILTPGRLANLKATPVFTLSGWLVTALAASLGAPFWFDLLNKIMVIRSTVKPHQKSPEEPSEAGMTETKAFGAAPLGAGTAGAPVLAFSAAARNDPDALDGCDLPIVNIARDEDLPLAVGGVL